MRLLGLDVGSKTVGVAVSDELGSTAQKVTTILINERHYNFGMRKLKKIVRHFQPQAIILGLPKRLDGSLGTAVARSQAYGQRVKEKFALPVHYVDERLTTVEANRVLIQEAGVHDRHQRKKVVDQMAAVLILQNYLDLHRKD